MRRPRTFADEDVFVATTAILTRLGYGRLTLVGAVVRELGCTAPALIRRFGSKRTLVRAYLEWTLSLSAERFRSIRETNPSPLDVLRTRILLPVNQRPEDFPDAAEPSGRANFLMFWIQAGHDPDFHPMVASRTRVFGAEFAKLLREAVTTREIAPCDASEVANTLVAAIVGATKLWVSEPTESRGAVVDCIGRVFDGVIGPYCTQGLPA